jgi:hypothetical protein
MIIFMAERVSAMNSLFLDTSYAVALSAVNDENHQRAEDLAEQA